jgi:pimeloyl-ACP methyl ester carboxylesterase
VLKTVGLIVAVFATLLAMPVASFAASDGNFAAGFSEHTVSAGGRTIYYRIGGNMRVGFSYFAGFDKDAIDDANFAKTPLQMPVLVMGGEKSMGALMPEFGKAVAVNVQTVVIPDAGHWLMDENPSVTITALVTFLAAQPSS